MKLLQSPLFWLAVLLLAGAGVLVVRVLRKNPDDTTTPRRDDPASKQPGFKDALKDPDEWKEGLDESERALDQARRAAKSWDDQTVDREVRRFVFDVKDSREAWLPERVLKSLGTRVHPTLLACLRDSALRARLVAPTGTGVLPETPFHRLSELLGEGPPAASVGLLTPFLDDPSSQIRKEAGLVIGRVGSAAAITPLRKALADSDEYVRSYAMIGLRRAIEAKRLDDVCRKELFADVKVLVSGGKNVRDAAQLLILFDEPQAIEFLRSDPFMTAEYESLHDVVRALTDNRVRIDRKRLLDLVAPLAAKANNYPGSYQLGEVLRALGRHQAAADRAIFEQYLAHGQEEVASGACDGLLTSHGLDGFRDRIWKTVNERGTGGLTEPQRRYLAVTMFDSEVNNGGLSQYFFNSSGDEWPAAIAGLEAMGSKDRLAVLRQATTKFGKGGPSTDRDERMRQLSRIISADESAFEILDSRYYKSPEIIDVLLTRHVLQHPEAFR